MPVCASTFLFTYPEAKVPYFLIAHKMQVFTHLIVPIGRAIADELVGTWRIVADLAHTLASITDTNIEEARRKCVLDLFILFRLGCCDNVVAAILFNLIAIFWFDFVAFP